MAQKRNAHTGNMGLFIIFVVVYIGLLILFAWQTWTFVDWLYPNDQLLMKLLTVLCFDVMALLWACLDLFYRFAVRGARTLVRWAWAISFVLSLFASIFYLILESMFRFQIPLTQASVNIGYGVTIVALVLQVLFITFWLYQEWNARHPHQDDYDPAPTPQRPRIQAAQPTQIIREERPVPALPAPQDDNARMSALVAELRDLVASGKANGQNFDYFGDDLKSLVKRTQPANETTVTVKPARFTPPPQQEIDTEDLAGANDDPVSDPGADDDEEQFETMPVRAVTPAKEATRDETPLLDRVSGGILDFLAGTPESTRGPKSLKHKQRKPEA